MVGVEVSRYLDLLLVKEEFLELVLFFIILIFFSIVGKSFELRRNDIKIELGILYFVLFFGFFLNGFRLGFIFVVIILYFIVVENISSVVVVFFDFFYV